MRLNGKAAIMAHVGCPTPENWRAWTMVRLRYGRVIYKKRASGKMPRYWAMSEEMDAIDREQSDSVYDLAYNDLVAAASTLAQRVPEARRRKQELDLVPA